MFTLNFKLESKSTPLLIMKNGDRELEFDITETTRKSLKSEYMYDVINAYLNTLDQTDLNRFFRAARDVSMGTYFPTEGEEGFNFVRERLETSIASLHYGKFLEWFRENHQGVINPETKLMSRPLYIPDTVAKEFDNSPGSVEVREKTYIVSEYIDLVGMILFMRMLFPIYTEYLTYNIRANKHPYLRVFSLFLNTDLDYEGSPLEKLREYVRENYLTIFKGKDSQHLLISAGLSEDDVDEYLMAESVIKKLLCMRFFDTDNNPVAHIFQTVRYEGRFSSAASARLKIKNKEPKGSEEDFSHFENFRKTTDIPQGTVVELQFALGNTNLILQSLGFDVETFDWDMYNEELKNVSTFMDEEIDEVRICLLAVFLKDFVNPRALFFIEKRRLIELLALAKVCLFMRGHAFIGMFLTSSYDESSSLISLNVTTRNTLTSELQDRLSKLFKYSINDKGDLIEKSVIDYSKQITNLTWFVRGTRVGNYVNEDGHLLVPKDINEILVSYIEFVVNGK